jgi:outer membrane protein assembly factor BamB
MKNLSLLTIFCLLIASCGHVNNNKIAYRISEKDLIPEGIIYSSTTNSFYLSSIYKTKIVQIHAETGELKDFIPSNLLRISFLGLIIDDTRNHLWACGNMKRYGERVSLVSKFSLNTGELIKTYSYIDTVANTYNDLAKDENGNIYFTDSDGQYVYKIDNQTDSISIFFDGTEISHPNGITISPDNKFLYVASNEKGIRVLDIEKREIIGEPDSSTNSKGIDGLKYYKNSLIGIQNEVKTKSEVKIAQYLLDNTGTKITGMKIIDQNNPHFNIPTTFVIVDNHLFCLANSQLGNISSSELRIINPEELNDVLILKYELK